jgi:hypothetical protein
MSGIGAVELVAQSAEQKARTVLPSMMTCGVRKSVEPPQCAQRCVEECELSAPGTIVLV